MIPVQFATSAPGPQQTADIFKGTWASALPPQINAVAGNARLFEDPRVDWAIAKLKPFGIEIGKSTIVELGPLEGAHTYLLSRAGAAAVTAIEANSQAYLKCLVVKELLGIERVNFLYGDGVAFLREVPYIYDVGFVCGFLYHLMNPVELLHLLSQRCRTIFLWTVYWDPEFVASGNANAGGRGPVREVDYLGFKHRLHGHDYGETGDKKGFWGGTAPQTAWMERDELLAALRHFGYSRIEYELESTPFGSAIKLVAALATA